MNDRRLSFSVSASCALAWLTWMKVAVLFAVGLWLHSMFWVAGSLVLSAAAATLHIRCFVIQLRTQMVTAYELGRESERVTHLRIDPGR